MTAGENSVVHRTHAKVFACLIDRELRIEVLPGSGSAFGGSAWNVPVEQVPFAARTPNSLLWITWEAPSHRIPKIEARDVDDESPMY
jgi:hypothetical protein